jgi:hypothetical protein
MKRMISTTILSLITCLLWAQATNDKRGFQGTVVCESKDEVAAKTEIQFTARTIVIENDTYEIVKKEFDGKDKTTFTCTKRRGTFEIIYKAGESITVTDQANKDVVGVYSKLSEK